MKYYGKLICPTLLALAAALSACGKQAAVPTEPAAPELQAFVKQRDPQATVLGPVKDNDWYMVVTTVGSTKPIVIWSESKSTCEREVGEFSLKAVDPASTIEPPKSWCMQGREIRAKLGA